MFRHLDVIYLYMCEVADKILEVVVEHQSRSGDTYNVSYCTVIKQVFDADQKPSISLYSMVDEHSAAVIADVVMRAFQPRN